MISPKERKQVKEIKSMHFRVKKITKGIETGMRERKREMSILSDKIKNQRRDERVRARKNQYNLMTLTTMVYFLPSSERYFKYSDVIQTVSLKI